MGIFEEINKNIEDLLKEKGFTIREWLGATIKPKSNISKKYRALSRDINLFIEIKEIE